MSRKSERLKYQVNEPFGFLRFLGRGSFLSPGRALRLLAESALAIPIPRFQYIFRGVAFAFRLRIAIFLRRSSFSRGRPSGNARGADAMRLTLPPVRAQFRRGEKETATP